MKYLVSVETEGVWSEEQKDKMGRAAMALAAAAAPCSQHIEWDFVEGVESRTIRPTEET